MGAVARFVMLTRKNDAPLDFDFDKVLEQSRENPVFYCNMPMRACSVLPRDVAGIAVDDATLLCANLSELEHPSELSVARKNRRMAASGCVAARK